MTFVVMPSLLWVHELNPRRSVLCGNAPLVQDFAKKTGALGRPLAQQYFDTSLHPMTTVIALDAA